jgi:hypothetical protein
MSMMARTEKIGRSAATANSTGKRGEETGRLDEMSAGSMSLPELLQEH